MVGICNFCKRDFHKRERKYKFCSLTCANRFNLNGLNKVSLPTPTKELAEFIGICLGDGYASKYQVSITLNSIADEKYLPYVVNLSKTLFPGTTISLIKKEGNATDIRINSVLVAKFLKSMGIIPNVKSIPIWIFDNSEYIKACIRGLLDTEGSISFKKYKSKKGVSLYKQLNFRNADVKLMSFVRDYLVTLGLRPTITLKRSLYISNHRDIDTFRKLIGFSNPKLLERSLICKISDYEKWRAKSLVA